MNLGLRPSVTDWVCGTAERLLLGGFFAWMNELSTYQTV